MRKGLKLQFTLSKIANPPETAGFLFGQFTFFICSYRFECHFSFRAAIGNEKRVCMDEDDFGLLRDYCERGSEAAFEKLVQTRLGFVYSTALRLTRDPALAQDVTHSVFLLLARKAATLKRGTVVAGWLDQTTRNVARCALRMEARRQYYEYLASRQMPLHDKLLSVA